jgi:uncharacterized tellurite resistance protein B-like protein
MKEKLSVLTALIQMALADKEVNEEEYQLMLGMAKLLGVSKSEFDQLFNSKLQFIAPVSEFERIVQFHRLLLVAYADKELSAEERTQLKKFGLIMALRPEALDRVFDALNDYPHGQIPAAVMINIFQAYHN